MAVDYYLPETLRDRIALVQSDERAELLAVLDRLLADPEPDGVTKFRMPRHFPYTERHMEARLGKYRICYQYAGPENRAVLYIFAIEPLPPLRREHPGPLTACPTKARPGDTADLHPQGSRRPFTSASPSADRTGRG